MSDWVDENFPGDGHEIPADTEWDRVDALIAERASFLGVSPVAIYRKYPLSDLCRVANAVAGQPTNRDFLRSQLRRWWDLDRWWLQQ